MIIMLLLALTVTSSLLAENVTQYNGTTDPSSYIRRL